jgi:protein-S-isoprenylcysteine O-methyltransferase Ste14
MKRNINGHLAILLNGGAGIVVITASIFVDFRLPIPKAVTKPLGIFFVFIGMALVGLAALYIKESISGEVETRLEVLVKQGPYRFVRHPVYLGMTIAFIGVAIAFRSIPGLIGVFVLLLPTEIYRAKLEEKALAQKFGAEWVNYRKQTGFILPILRKHYASGGQGVKREAGKKREVGKLGKRGELE